MAENIPKLAVISVFLTQFVPWVENWCGCSIIGASYIFSRGGGRARDVIIAGVKTGGRVPEK